MWLMPRMINKLYKEIIQPLMQELPNPRWMTWMDIWMDGWFRFRFWPGWMGWQAGAGSYEILMPGNNLIWRSNRSTSLLPRASVFFIRIFLITEWHADGWVAERIAWHKMINKKCKKKEIYYAGSGDVREMLMMDHKQKMQSKIQKVYKYINTCI